MQKDAHAENDKKKKRKINKIAEVFGESSGQEEEEEDELATKKTSGKCMQLQVVQALPVGENKNVYI